MSFSTNLKELRTNLGLKQQELAERLHVSQQAIAKWENGKAEPNVSTLRDIANALDCTIDDLLGESKIEELSVGERMAVREGHSLSMINFEKMCRQLDEKTLGRVHTILYSIRRLQGNSVLTAEDKQCLFEYIAKIIGRIELFADDFRYFSDDNYDIDFYDFNKRFMNSEIEIMKEIVSIIVPKNKEKKDIRIVIPFYETPASAGLGTWLNEETPVEWVTVPKNSKTTSADFILEVRGDSMQPKFLDGDCVLVKQSESIFEGEIGVFILNGESYIKKMGKGELISLNSKYPPIKLHDYDDVRCAGKVIDTIVLE